MKQRAAIFALISLLFLSCGRKQGDFDYTSYVNVFTGTGGHGHTFPGAVLPFGMVQLSPDTRTLGWDACAGYHYTDSLILGFSHRHLSGTGMTDFADILITPFSGQLQTQNDSLLAYYPLAFSHKNEEARPGWYAVKFDNGIGAELTATERTGLHRYNFPAKGTNGLIVDLFHNLHNQKVRYAQLKVVDNHTISGMRITEGWSKRDYIYFQAEFSQPFNATLFSNNKATDQTAIDGTHLKAVLRFDAENVEVKVGLSAVDNEGAQNNLKKEAPDWNFEKIQENALRIWNEQLGKVHVEGGSETEKKNFYTSLYHLFIHPSLYSDCDGRYRGQDLEIHQLDNGRKYYTVFSLWDVYRAQLPYLALIQPSRVNEFVRSLLLKYQQGGLLPMWDLAGCYTGTMIGAHSTSFIADAYMKGLRDYDTELAYKAMWRSIPYDTTGILVHHPAIWEWLMTKGKKYNEEMGFIPADKDVIFATSRGLEYAYCDWALAQVAQNMGKADDYNLLAERGMRYKKYFDQETGFMRALDSNGKFIEPFNPNLSNHMNSPYCEGNAWQWTWFVPHDVDGLIGLMGGKQKFEERLDTLFNTTAKVEGEEASADISGLIGQYAHGNEPSHHIAYFYNYIGKPHKTQSLIDRILREQYSPTPEGISGNEDCGQMSAWYVMNALGFYQVAPGNPVYTISRPLFDKAVVQLENGKQLIIRSENNSKESKFVKQVSVNGKLLEKPIFNHADVKDGGELIFNMSPSLSN